MRVGTTADIRRAEAASEVGVTVTGRRGRTLIAGVMISILAVAAFAGGRIAARGIEVDDRIGLTASGESGTAPGVSSAGGSHTGASLPDPESGDELRAQPAAVPPAAPGKVSAVSAVTDAVGTLRFEAFAEPTSLIAAETATEVNNSTGIDTTALGDTATAAVVGDLVVTGPAGSTVAVHPGDRPADALRFTIPSSGRLLVPHLIVPTDNAGRVVVSADTQVRVDMTGIGRYVPADSARAGRFVPTGSIRIGSLVTATDGRRLVISLSDALGADAAIVGQAVVRLNANVSQAGGSVAVGSGDPIPWPGPAARDLGLAGTELLTVEPNEQGEIIMDYLGGSILTVDLVGYYTNDAAPESSSGLLILAKQPELRTIEVEGGVVAVEAGPPSALTDGDDLATSALVTVEVTNGETGGSITFWNDRAPVPTSAAFALAQNQQRSTTEWFDPTEGSTTLIDAPEGAILQIWMLGTYT